LGVSWTDLKLRDFIYFMLAILFTFPPTTIPASPPYQKQNSRFLVENVPPRPCLNHFAQAVAMKVSFVCVVSVSRCHQLRLVRLLDLRQENGFSLLAVPFLSGCSLHRRNFTSPAPLLHHYQLFSYRSAVMASLQLQPSEWYTYWFPPAST